MNDPIDESPLRTRTLTPWHSEPLAWLVFGLPATVVVASFVTLAIAIHSADDLVVDDYYKAGLEINKTLAREQRAATLGLGFRLDLAPDGHFTLTLTAAPDFVYPDALTLRFTHATRAADDRLLTVQRAGDASYPGRVAALPPGSWYIDVSTPAWRMVERRQVR